MTSASLTRRDWMGLLARAPLARLDTHWPDEPPAFMWLRAPEIGTMMVQGRAGAVGAAFNLGEVTVTRAALRLSCGTVGHAMVQGRGLRKAERAALLDALLQTSAGPELQARVLGPLQAAERAAQEARARRAAATKVDFFTLARGEG
ncbi:alpha-D-ribose 1-methylphosphonate 5-triphosphate synthase subunit PhnG [Roseinatronobacter thiooxidans]|uniref:Alpha-D-ribose 1-methylphosphonate 5-triphosphate synthase subunit PhnG n=1 Tax=Roseinatronobacter thiooxidans TaxID=121821 RepID=A0A2W7QAB3_9RHOB|nr:phosphonate C-P lyase system protein PhnG [Roseinatronobacter thiooxidans]PZX38009.1 alpha-D-ribose 1-methylphosphonate 5-triphosphate synthase subunit PhnG [Roseinatronobacter thiooxidans]